MRSKIKANSRLLKTLEKGYLSLKYHLTSTNI